MTIDRTVFFFAGCVVLATVIASIVAKVEWPLYITLFVGANMLQASITTFCPLALFLKLGGVKPGAAFYNKEVLKQGTEQAQAASQKSALQTEP
jgi:hypothetical protein